MNISNSFTYGVISLLISFLKIFIIDNYFGEEILKEFTLFLPFIMLLVSVRQLFFDINKNKKNVLIDSNDFILSGIFLVIVISFLLFKSSNMFVYVFLFSTVIESLINIQVSKRKAIINYALILIRLLAILSLLILPISYYVIILSSTLIILYFNDVRQIKSTFKTSILINKKVFFSFNVSFFSFLRDFLFTYFLQIIIPDGQYFKGYVFIKICQQSVGFFYQTMRILDESKRKEIYRKIGESKKLIFTVVFIILSMYFIGFIDGLILYGIIGIFENLLSQLLIFLEKKPELFLTLLNIFAVLFLLTINFG